MFLLIILIVSILIILYYNLPYPNNIMRGFSSNLYLLINAEKTLFFILLTYILALVWIFIAPSRAAKVFVMVSSLAYIIAYYTFIFVYHYDIQFYYPFITKLSKSGHSIFIFDWSHMAILTLAYFLIKEFIRKVR